jgi:hypothetical protein
MTHRLTISIALAAQLALAGGALAEPVVAKLQTALPGAEKPVAGGAVFECLGDVCAARTPSADTAGLRGCRDLARQIGAIAAFGAGAKPLAAADLATCNLSARK